MKKIFIILCCFTCVSCAEKKYTDDGNRVQKWADYSYVDEFPFDEDFELKIKLDVFPDTEFIWREYEILASTDGTERVLLGGMPIINAFFADLNADGFPELCSSVMFGSGICDEHIVVYDYHNGQDYFLWDRGEYDYHLFSDDGGLYVKKLPYGWQTEENAEIGKIAIEGDLLVFRESGG